ncbi:hypothetical protein DICVIV_10949 [Dictyocaulus viviparus]|uniref:Uncharacterized protein n=1 Tax=Dictyocaulus viviparus TaxID=29172 RepID=A0A0D8XH34_DICVI|nr:hypothetical protein DICVIV_10949 [Dictyocaulus viviparus]
MTKSKAQSKKTEHHRYKLVFQYSNRKRLECLYWVWSNDDEYGAFSRIQKMPYGKMPCNNCTVLSTCKQKECCHLLSRFFVKSSSYPTLQDISVNNIFNTSLFMANCSTTVTSLATMTA